MVGNTVVGSQKMESRGYQDYRRLLVNLCILQCHIHGPCNLAERS